MKLSLSCTIIVLVVYDNRTITLRQSYTTIRSFCTIIVRLSFTIIVFIVIRFSYTNKTLEAAPTLRDKQTEKRQEAMIT